MGLRVKIILPLVLLGLLFAVYMWWIWAPSYLQEEREHYLGHYQMELDIFADGIAPALVRGDLRSLRQSLDRLKFDYPVFQEVRLENNKGDVLYAYKDPKAPANGDEVLITQGVNLAGKGGLLEVKVDLHPEMELDRTGLARPLRLLWFILLITMMPIAYILDRWLRVPLVKLAEASQAMVQGDYVADLPPPSGDEIGVLVKQFAEMRSAIATKEQSLQQEIINRQTAEILLEQDFEVQKAIGDVLRIAMEAVTLEEFLREALDVILELSWLVGQAKGAIFTSEDDGAGLVMRAQRNMPASLIARCKKVSLCHCLCGQAAAQRKVIFSAHLDERHETHYEDMEPHGHIVIPILISGRLLGVMNFYLADGAIREVQCEKALLMLADVVAIAIERKRADRLLKEQAQIMAQIRDAVIGVDRRMSVRVWNQGAERLFGYRSDEVIGRNMSMLFEDGASRALAQTIIFPVMNEGHGEAHVGMIKKSGEEFPAYLSASIFKGQGDASVGMLAYVMDNTEAIRMREELSALNADLDRQVKERTREVLNQKFALDQHAIVGITDKAGRIIYANDKFCELSGYSREELLGEDHRILNSEYHSRGFFKAMWQTIGRGKVWHGEFRNRRKDGGIYWVYTTIVPFMDDRGRPYQYVSIRADITERMAALEEQSARSQRMKRHQDTLTLLTRQGVYDAVNLFGSLRTIMEAAALAVDAEQVRIWLFSPDAAELHCEALISPTKPVQINDEIITRANCPAFFKDVENKLVIAADDVHVQPWARELVDGHLGLQGICSMLCVPIRSNGKVKGAACFEHTESYRHWHADEQQFGIVVADMMALTMEQAGRLAAEARQVETAQQLRAANEQLDNALVKAQAAAHAKSEFLATMSHEVRTPMNGIMGMLELMRDSDLNDEDKGYLNIAYRSASMLLELLNNVLDFSRFEAGQLNLELVEFDPWQVIEEVANLMRSLADAKTLDLRVEKALELPENIYGDPLRFRQVLVNLISNAIKFTAEGYVIVRGEMVGRDSGKKMVLIEIEDTGVGVDIEDQAHIFDAFTQADSSVTRRYGGSGLGLTICKQLVLMIGGEIGVKSIAGQGSIFWFTVPVVGGDTLAMPAKAASTG
jgi:PAS domain S-box-containing protein